MYGAIIGDIVGSVYERANVKTKDFELFTSESCFTDDTVLSAAVAEKLLRSADSILNTAKTKLNIGLKNVADEFCAKYGIKF